MAGKWPTARISDVATVTDYVANGSFESLRKNVTYRNEPDYAVLVRLVDHNAGWSGDFVYVDRSSYNFLRKSLLVPGDVVIANVGANAGTVFRAPDLGRPMTLGPNAVLCSPRREDELTRDYLYYYLISQSGQASLQNILSGSAQPKFNKTDLRRLSVPIPPLAEQRAIAHILGTLDDKIELNRRMSEILEAMARAVFKSWFVDFDPVRAKAEGRDPDLPQPLADLFPGRLVDSELGDIPEGWEVGAVRNLADVSSGRRPEFRYSEPLPEASVPLWGGNGPTGFVPEPLIDEPILLTGRVGTLGSVFRISAPCWPSDNTLVLRANRPSAFEYLYFQLRQVDYASLNRGSTQPLLTQTDLKSQRVILPPCAILDHFSRFASGACRWIDIHEQESRTLAALRDILLPKLISGEVRVGARHQYERERLQT